MSASPRPPSGQAPPLSPGEQPRLPPALESFLSLYPHPVFALRARPIFDALISRRSPYAPEQSASGGPQLNYGGLRRGFSSDGPGGRFPTAQEQYEEGSESVPSPMPAGVHNVLLEQERLDAAAALAASGIASPSPSETPSFANTHLSSRRSSTSGLSRASPSGRESSDSPAMRAHLKASRILSDAFETPGTAHSHGYPALDRVTLLEEGGQASHASSRTAEGAVAALKAQRAQHDRQVEQDGKDEEQHEEQKEQARKDHEAKQQINFEQGDRWSGGQNSDGTARAGGGTWNTAGTSMQMGGVGLKELLTPCWRNGRWKEMTAIRKEARTDGVDDEEIDLLSLLSRDDAQELMAMLANVVAVLHPGAEADNERRRIANTPLAQLDHTVLLQLNLPETSVYRHTRGSTFSHDHSKVDSLPTSSDEQVRPILTRTPPSMSHPSYSSTNSYAYRPPSNQNPAVPTPHRSIQEETALLRPFLQVVATLNVDSGLVVCTTIVANMPLPVEDRQGRTLPLASASAPRERSPPRNRPPLRSTPSSSRPSRPPLTSRNTSNSSISAASSSGSTILGAAAANEESQSTSSPLSAELDRSSLLKRRPTDNVPTPLQQWFEGPAHVAPPVEVATTAGAAPPASRPPPPRRLPVEIPGAVSGGGGGDGASGGLAYPDPVVRASANPDSPTEATSPNPELEAVRAIYADSYTRGDHSLPRGFVKEKEERAARRRQMLQDRDNEERDRQHERRLEREKERERGKQAAKEVRDREGLGELREVDESAGDGENDDGDGSAVKEYDEADEEDDAELTRLRAKTRTGSTSSGGNMLAHNEGEADDDDDDEVIKADAAPLAPMSQSPKQSISPHPPLEHRSSGNSQRSTSSRAGSAVSIRSAASYRSAISSPRAGAGARFSSASASEIDFPPTGNPFLDTLAHTPCGRIIRSLDWSETSLGDISTWTAELRSHVLLMLASPFHEALWMGEDHCLLYNDAYSRILGARHPAAMGKAGALGWSEVWDILGPLASQVMRGKTVSFSDHCICHVRAGMLEETYMSWAYIPMRDASGDRIVGYSNPSFETTARVIAERRLGTLRELTQLTALARTTRDFCAKALRALSSNALDLPFVILYTVETVPHQPNKRTKGASTDSSGARRTSEVPTSSANQQGDTVAKLRLTLQGAVGVPKGHPSAANVVEVLIDMSTLQDDPAGSSAESVSSFGGTHSTNDDNASSTVWPLVEALTTRKPVFISDVGQRAHGFLQRGWPDDVRRAVVVPIMTEGSTFPKALKIIGLNPRRPFNEVYGTFLSLITRGMSTGLLSIDVAEEQAKKSQELTELNDARTVFFSNISHELRTPLTLILGPLEDVLQSKEATLPDADRDKLGVVQRNAHRLLNMVNTLLDFSRLESGQMDAVYRPTLLGPRVAELASLFRAAVERGGIDFVVDIADDRWAEKKPFYLSAEMLEKIVFNILGNSYKYTLTGRIDVRVTFTPTEGVLAFQDSGVGIKDEDLSVIFDRFHRIDSSARSFEGTGIGLSLVLELVKALGGTIDVESELGTGSTFTVRLPRGSDHLPQDRIEDEPFEMVALPPRAAQSMAIINDASAWRVESRPAQESKGTATPTARRASDAEPLPAVFNLGHETTCLVVDDNAQLRSFIASTLSKTFTVVEKKDGQEALDYALANPVQIVITDIAMPVMNGRELLTKLRQNASTSLIPVIFLSAAAGAEARVDALLAGADDYLVKPFQARELLARVNVHLQLGQMRMELERRVLERTAELVESEKQFRVLSEQHQTLALVSPVGIFQTTPDGEMVFVNPQFMAITGHPEDVPHSQWRGDIDPADLPRVEKLWGAAISDWRPDKGVTTFDYRYKNGKYAQLEIRSYDGGFIGSITDVSHQKEVEAFHIREVESRAQEAEENRRNTEMFLDVSSHELRNPLSGVWQNAEVVGASLDRFLDFLEDLRAGKAAEPAVIEEMHEEMLENVDAVESIMLCASHQQRIADDILNVSKLNMGLLSIQVAPFDLAAAVREVVKTFDAQSQQQHIKLGVANGPSFEALAVDWIVADSGRVKQVLINFLANAMRYATDSERKEITVRLDAFDHAPPASGKRIASPDQSFEPPPECIWVRVAVEDSGKGLSPEQLDTLFARFAQANPKTDQYGGAGLGLFVSRSLVELHRGFIEVDSALGKGSTFSFTIPASRAARPSPSQLSALSRPSFGTKRLKRPVSSNGRASAAVQPLVSPASTGVAPIHVLVVEDNSVNVKVMLRQLKGQGFEVSVAGDGQQALDALAEDNRRVATPSTEGDKYNGIRVVLMDIEMPVMGGLEAIRHIRERERSGDLQRRYPVCAVTGNAREAQKQDCLQAGFDDVAIKPYRLQELLQQISRLTGLPVAAPK
ncbi:hypothetical protein JCM10207_005367 [Rhodosporidiobolus poonsookiae]